MTTFPRIMLKKGREKSLLRGHPWIFSGAIEKMEGEIVPGDIGEVYSKEGQFLGMGHLNPRSQIVFRLLTSQKENLEASFFRDRISKAVTFRAKWFRGQTNAYRIINGEGDFLPGLFVDRYGDILVLQISTAGMERLKGLLVELLIQELHPRTIYERSDVAARKEEDLSEVVDLLYGQEIPNRIDIEEYGARFWVNVKEGQKTGFYLDQRENRLLVSSLSEGKKVLDCFSYTGGFSIVSALGGGTQLTLVDSSEEALSLAEENVKLNRLEDLPRQMIRGDVFDVLRTTEARFDLIILDPPPFAKKKSHLPRASRGYKDLNLHAFRLLSPGGLLLTFCCSHHVGWDLFQKIVFSAALDTGRNVQLLSRRGQPADHPFSLSHPEGEYLKGFLCKIM
jgi:23S rRNA (cytosine1962-C5)-methyltransferase